MKHSTRIAAFTGWLNQSDDFRLQNGMMQKYHVQEKEMKAVKDEICALLGCYAASCGNCLQTFRDNVSVPSSRVKSPKYSDSWPWRWDRYVKGFFEEFPNLRMVLKYKDIFDGTLSKGWNYFEVLFLQNVSKCLPYYMASHPSRRSSSYYQHRQPLTSYLYVHRAIFSYIWSTNFILLYFYILLRAWVPLCIYFLSCVTSKNRENDSPKWICDRRSSDNVEPK
jgi:hypothetical protein